MRFGQFPLVAAAIFLLAADVLASPAQDKVMAAPESRHSLRALNSEIKSLSPTAYDDDSDEDPTYPSDDDQLSDTTKDSTEDEERWYWYRTIDATDVEKPTAALTKKTSEYGKWNNFLRKFLKKVLPGTTKDR